MHQLIILIPLFISIVSYSQKNKYPDFSKNPPTAQDFETDARNHNCIKKKVLNLSDRVKNYPFSSSSQVQLVSFEQNTDTSENGYTIIENSLPRNNDTICYSKLKEIKSLTLPQIDKLTDILYNYGFKGAIFTETVYNCYIPRNAILFIDSSGNVIEYIEICFQCQKIKESSEKIKPFDLCDQKLDLLREFFKKCGLKYGVSNP